MGQQLSDPVSRLFMKTPLACAGTLIASGMTTCLGARAAPRFQAVGLAVDGECDRLPSL
jgi:hypothetical protein